MGIIGKIFIIATVFFNLNAFASEASRYLVEIGRSYYQQGNYPEAEHEFKKALMADAQDPQAQYYLNLVLSKIKPTGSIPEYKYEQDISLSNVPSYSSRRPLKQYVRGRDMSKDLDRIESILNHRKSKNSKLSSGSNQVRLTENKNQKIVSGNKTKTTKVPLSEPTVSRGEKLLNISGDYQISFGITPHDFIWKNANADKAGVPYEKNWRYLWGSNRYNTYDEAIFDRLRVNFKANESKADEGWGGFLQFVVDPWTFIGVAKVDAPRSQSINESTGVVTSDTPVTDWAHIKLKYASGSSRTIDEVYRSDQGNIVVVPETKINHGNFPLTWANGASESWGGHGQFEISPSGIDYMYRPIRQFFVDYKSPGFKFRFFPMAYDNQALSSDDPLRLSNNHIWWEESPWLDSYEPSRVFSRSGNPLKTGRWVRRWSFIARDSDLQRLTFLRGVSFTLDTLSGLNIKFTEAAPMSLWDRYEFVNSIEGALRVTYNIDDKNTIGFTHTNKLGLAKRSLQAKNFVYAVDYSRILDAYSKLYSQVAHSTMDVNEANGVDTSSSGYAYKLGYKHKDKIRIVNASVTYIDNDFYPGLSNYRYTSFDPFWSKHIRFAGISPEDKASYLGDSIERNRLAAVFTYKWLFGKDKDILFNLRNAHTTNGAFVDNTVRMEGEYRAWVPVLFKWLLWYKRRPKTTAGRDPIITTNTIYSFTDYFSGDTEFVRNDAVEGGKDPSTGHFGIGTKYDFNKFFPLRPCMKLPMIPKVFPARS